LPVVWEAVSSLSWPGPTAALEVGLIEPVSVEMELVVLAIVAAVVVVGIKGLLVVGIKVLLVCVAEMN